LFVLVGPISSEFSLLVALKSLTNLSEPLANVVVLSISDADGNEQFGLRVSSRSVQLTVTVLEGSEQTKRRVPLHFEATLYDRKWHRLAFSFEVSLKLYAFCLLPILLLWVSANADFKECKSLICRGAQSVDR